MTHDQQHLTRKINMLENPDREENFPAEDLLKLIPIEKSNNILDLGAGTGYLALPAAKEIKGTVYALDLDADILNYLDTKAKDAQLDNVKTLVGSFTNIPLEVDSVDIALASLSLHEVTPLSKALKEINRVMTKDGYFLCLEFEKREETLSPRVHSSVMEKELINAGFTINQKIFPSATIANENLYILIAQK